MSTLLGVLRSASTNTFALARHFRIRLLAVVRDPVALGLLVVAGLATIPFWHPMGFHYLLIDARGRWPYFWGPAVFGVFFWAPLVVLPVSGALGHRGARASTGRILPALPVGPRCRATAEAMVGLLVVAAIHAPASLFYQHWLYPQLDPWGCPDCYFFWAMSLTSTLADSAFGLLFALPFVLAWAAVPRLAWSHLSRPLAVFALVLAAVASGMTRTTAGATFVWVALAIAVPATIGVELAVDVIGLPRWRSAPPHRASPGPSAQFRRDFWQGVPRRCWPYLLVILSLPILLSSVWAGPRSVLALMLLSQLAILLLYPFGIRLVSVRAPGGAGLFNGYFATAWSTLPVSRPSVLRAVYAHGLIGTALLWLLLFAQVANLPSGDRIVMFELPAVLLVPAVLLCEAAGDRMRGALALGALLAFQFGVPSTSLFLELTVGAHLRPAGGILLAVSYLLALIGGLPPLVHLRGTRGAVIS